MAWNPDPKVADCRDIARKWGGKKHVIILALDDTTMEMATYGATPKLCDATKVLGDKAYNAVIAYLESL